MATWQAAFRLVAPLAVLPSDYPTRFETVLPAGRLWSAEIEQWGTNRDNAQQPRFGMRRARNHDRQSLAVTRSVESSEGVRVPGCTG